MNLRYLTLASGCLLLASLGCERKKPSTVAERIAPNQELRPSLPPLAVEPQPLVPQDRRSRLNAAAMESMLKMETFEDPADGYFQGYLKVKASEQIESRDNSIRLLHAAESCFREVKNRFPDWKTEMVDARIQKTQEAISKHPLSGR